MIQKIAEWILLFKMLRSAVCYIINLANKAEFLLEILGDAFLERRYIRYVSTIGGDKRNYLSAHSDEFSQFCRTLLVYIEFYKRVKWDTILVL